MKVWVLSKGENYEGSRVIGVYSERWKAIQVAETLDDGKFAPHPTVPDFWTEGIDYLSLNEYEVQ